MKVTHQDVKIVEGHPPANYTGAAIDANYVSLKGYGWCTIVIQTGAWAGGTAAVTLNKATDVAGAGEVPADIDYMYTNDGATATDTLTKTAVANDTFNLDTANAMYIIEVDPASLGDYDCIQLAVASPGANNDYHSSVYILSQSRYPGGESPVPSALLD